MRTHSGLALLVSAVALAAGVAIGSPTATAAPPPLAGAWTWDDHDELLSSRRNPAVAVVAVRGTVVTLRFGREPASRVALSRNGRAFTVVARRWAGPRGKARVRVRYTGRVTNGASGARISGRLDVLHPRYPGLSAFSAVARR